MPFTIKLDQAPHGYSLKAVKKDELAEILTRGFSSFEDGSKHIKLLEGFPTEVIRLLPKESKIKESQIDHLVALIESNGSTTVYINELNMICTTRVRKSLKAGESISDDDIVDIDSLYFEGLEIPKNVGVIVIISKGWRNGMFFDFSPLVPEQPPRTYDLWKTLGNYYNYLVFQEVFNILEETWKTLFSQKWFPFLALKSTTLRKLVSYAEAGWQVDDILDEINHDVKQMLLPTAIERWSGSELFKPHLKLFERAIERYDNNDYESAISLLFPRIEGLMRTINQSVSETEHGQKQLALAPIKASRKPAESYSRLLPTRFHQYISEVYFANFDPNSSDTASFSRNSVSHGVAQVEDFNLKSALLGLLIVDQIYFHLPPKEVEISK